MNASTFTDTTAVSLAPPPPYGVASAAFTTPAVFADAMAPSTQSPTALSLADALSSSLTSALLASLSAASSLLVFLCDLLSSYKSSLFTFYGQMAENISARDQLATFIQSNRSSSFLLEALLDPIILISISAFTFFLLALLFRKISPGVYALFRSLYPLFSLSLLFLIFMEFISAFYWPVGSFTLLSHYVQVLHLTGWTGRAVLMACGLLQAGALFMYRLLYWRDTTTRAPAHLLGEYVGSLSFLYLYYVQYLKRLFEHHGYITVPILYREGATTLSMDQMRGVAVLLFVVIAVGRLMNWMVIRPMIRWVDEISVENVKEEEKMRKEDERSE